jgi:hypothetical protein
MNTSSFDLNEFQTTCEYYKKRLNCIICLENLNPRPETLLNDSEKLNSTFKRKELRDKLIISYNSSSNNMDLKTIRNDSLNFSVLFDNLLIFDQEEKKKYAKNNIFYKNFDDLKGRIMFEYYKYLFYKILIFLIYILLIIGLVFIILYFSGGCCSNTNPDMNKTESNKSGTQKSPGSTR